jgi:hypothetical protein
VAALDDAVSTLKGINSTLSSIWKILNANFPQVTGTATTATGGSATLPSQPTGFLEVTYNNVQYKIPVYKP